MFVINIRVFLQEELLRNLVYGHTLTFDKAFKAEILSVAFLYEISSGVPLYLLYSAGSNNMYIPSLCGR